MEFIFFYHIKIEYLQFTMAILFRKMTCWAFYFYYCKLFKIVIFADWVMQYICQVFVFYHYIQIYPARSKLMNYIYFQSYLDYFIKSFALNSLYFLVFNLLVRFQRFIFVYFNSYFLYNYISNLQIILEYHCCLDLCMKMNYFFLKILSL